MRVMYLGTKSAAGVPADIVSVSPFDAYVDERVGVFQVEFGGSATVTLEGRLNAACSFTTITSITSADVTKAKTVALMPLMRINISVYTSGAVTGYLGI